jgi:hypothetical protein
LQQYLASTYLFAASTYHPSHLLARHQLPILTFLVLYLPSMPPKRRQTALSAAAKRARTLLTPPSSQCASSASSRRASSPRQVLAAASQATEFIQTFESLLLESQLEDEIVRPMEGSQAATAPTTNAGHGDGEAEADADVDTNDDDFTGINWACLPDFMKPLCCGEYMQSSKGICAMQ